MNSGARRNNESSDNLQPGTLVSHYTIVEKIGEGGMGEVYLANDSRLRRQVALKFLPGRFVSDEEFKKRFMREAHTAAAVSHPNIVTIHDVEVFRGRPFIVMEYVEGHSIKARLRERELSLDEIVDFALQIARALERAHGAGIVHRDLKSDNILLTDDGRVKVLDFGLAKAEHDENLTQTGTVMGTVAYMSPEQARGGVVDQRSDLFSLGVVLYEMLTRRLPFTGNNMAAVITAILNAEPEPVCDDKLSQTPGLWDVVSRLLAKDVDTRYAAASDVIADLERIRQGLTPAGVVPERPRAALRISVFAAVAVACAATVKWLLVPALSPGADRGEIPAMLAVLPFENLGHTEHDYFAGGITDEITTQLTKLSGVRVVSRSSASQYRDTHKTHREIGRELGVHYLLEGSVRWDVSDTVQRIRINTSLTDVRKDISLWAESYQRVLHDIFQIQSDIARKVTTALDIALNETEQHSLDRQATDNLEAYNIYLQGLDYFNNRNWSAADELFHKAVALDSTFAQAWAALSMTESLLYWWYLDRSDLRLQKAKAAAETSLRLDSTLADAYLAMGRYYYRGYLDYENALQWYQRALAIQPNNSDLLFAIGSVKRRQGRWDEAVKLYGNAFTLDPRSPTKLADFARTRFLMRDFDAALQAVDQLIDLSPDYAYAYDLKARIFAYGIGSVDSARAVLADAATKVVGAELTDIAVTLDLSENQPDRAVERLTQSRHGDYFEQDSAYFYLQMGEVCHHLGRDAISRAHYDSALSILQVAVEQSAEEAQYYSMLGVAYAGLGDSALAVRHGKRATELCSVRDDALTGGMWRHNLAIIYTMVNNYPAAVEELRFLLSIPSDVTRPYLNTYAAFRDLRDDPGFQALLEPTS